MSVKEFIDPEYLKDQLDISTSELRDDLQGTDSRDLTDIYDELGTKLDNSGTIATISDISQALASQGGDELRVISI